MIIIDIIDKVLGAVGKVVSGNFELSKDELEQRIAKLQARRRKLNLELEEAHNRMYVKGWISDERKKENL